MSKSGNKAILAVIVIVVVCGFFFFVAMIYMVSRSSGDMVFTGLGGRLAQIDLEGVIYNSDDIVRQIDKYENDSSVKGLVLRVDSPGGGVAASQEIYDRLLKFKEEGKIIVVSMGAVAASGGYYVSCAADSIVANPGTITGSIGVILSYPVIDQLMGKIGMQMEVIKSGRLKDVGNYARQPTPEDRRMLQALIDDTYDQFIHVVSDTRGLEIDAVKKIADGSVYTGRQAEKLGLVDHVGSLDLAISMAGDMTGLGEKPHVVKERPPRRPFWAVANRLLGFDIESLIESQRTWPTLEYIYGY